MQNCRSHALFALAAVSASHVSAQHFGDEISSFTAYGEFTRVATADLDGDGDEDIVLAGPSPTTIAWCENLGGGTFRPQLPVVQDTSDGPKDLVATGDLDGDGDQDVLFAGDQNDGIGWVSNDGSGAFGDKRTIVPNASSFQELIAVDLDQDGRIDVAAYGLGAGLVWVRNLGGGTFAAPTSLNTGPGTVTALVAEDLDGDGDRDLIIAKENSDRIEWLEQTAPGSFGTVQLLTQAVVRPFSLQVLDVDADGDRDLVVGTVSNVLLKISRNLGGLQFGPPEMPTPSFIGATPIRMRDVDGDGLLDVVGMITSPVRYAYFRNTGTGFDLQATVPSDRPATDLRLFDYDGDGDLDVVATRESRAVVMNVDSAGLVEIATPTLRIEATADPLLGTSADVDGDGLADLLVSEAGAVLFPGAVHVLRNSGEGVWTGGQQVLVRNVAGATVVVDIDEDGDLDLISPRRRTGSPSVSIALNPGDGTFPALSALHIGVGLGQVEAKTGDLDADGDLDVFWSRDLGGGAAANSRHGWVEQIAPGQFGPNVDLPPLLAAFVNDIGDVDGDGDADLVYIVPSGTQAALVRNAGDGSFGGEELLGSQFFEFLRAICAGDVNGDDLADVVVVGDSTVSLFLAQPGGTLSGANTIDSSAGGTELLLRDVDRDGSLDLLVSGAGVLGRVYRNFGDGTFDVPQVLPERQLGSKVIEVADFDGDLDLDVLKQPPFGGFAWNTNLDRFGTAYCGPAETNSTGAPAAMSASVGASVFDNDVTLIAERLPTGSFGYFLVAPAAGFTPMAGGSSGTLCVGGAVGRLNRNPAEIFVASSEGVASVSLDLTDVPTPTGSVALVPGDTRYFQAWFRDANPGVTSNFTNGLRIAFE